MDDGIKNLIFLLTLGAAIVSFGIATSRWSKAASVAGMLGIASVVMGGASLVAGPIRLRGIYHPVSWAPFEIAIGVCGVIAGGIFAWIESRSRKTNDEKKG